jgi:hypothetical protein
MKSRALAPLALAFVSLSLVGSGCWLDSNDDVQSSFEQNQIRPGTYSSERCFMNKIESQTSGSARYSMATLVFNDDHTTGSGHYVTFTDAACTAQVSDTTFTFKDSSQVSIGGVAVIKFTQSGNVVNPTWWIPANVSNTGYSFDVDFTDGESGPYVFEPSPTDLSSFGQNPGQGVSFKQAKRAP